MTAKVVIGRDPKTNKHVSISPEARACSTYVIGITGTGKSTLLENIAYQDMVNGDGLCFLDPHGESARKLLASVPSNREQDVIFWDPADRDCPFGLNPFFCSDPNQIDSKADNFI